MRSSTSSTFFIVSTARAAAHGPTPTPLISTAPRSRRGPLPVFTSSLSQLVGFCWG